MDELDYPPTQEYLLYSYKQVPTEFFINKVMYIKGAARRFEKSS